MCDYTVFVVYIVILRLSLHYGAVIPGWLSDVALYESETFGHEYLVQYMFTLRD